MFASGFGFNSITPGITISSASSSCIPYAITAAAIFAASLLAHLSCAFQLAASRSSCVIFGNHWLQ